MANEFNKDNFEVKKVEGTAVLTYKEEDKYLNGNGDVSREEIEKVSKYNGEFIDSFTAAVTPVAQEILANDKDLTNAVATIDYGVKRKGSPKAGNITVGIKRSHTFPGVNGSEPVTKSTVKVGVFDPQLKMQKSIIKAYEKTLTDALLG